MPTLSPMLQPVALDLEIVGDRGKQALGQPRGLGRHRRIAHDQGEFVAADAAEEGACDRGAQPLRDRAQQAIAERMTEDVVDLLEAVEVDRQHREALVRLRRALQHGGEALVEGGAVGQFGQRVVVRQTLDAGLRPLTFGHVLDDA